MDKFDNLRLAQFSVDKSTSGAYFIVKAALSTNCELDDDLVIHLVEQMEALLDMELFFVSRVIDGDEVDVLYSESFKADVESFCVNDGIACISIFFKEAVFKSLLRNLSVAKRVGLNFIVKRGT